MQEIRWLGRSEETSWRSLQLMQMRLTARLARDLAESSGLSYADYVVLVALTDDPAGSLRLFELASQLGWEKSRLSHQLARMQQRGLVRKERCGTDRRGAVVSVSPLGRQEIQNAAPGHVACVRRFFVDILDADQLRVVEEVAQRVLAALAEEEADRGVVDEKRSEPD